MVEAFDSLLNDRVRKRLDQGRHKPAGRDSADDSLPSAPARDRTGRTGSTPTLVGETSTLPESAATESLELPVEELLRRTRPLPPYSGMVIDDLTPEEADAFLAAVQR